MILVCCIFLEYPVLPHRRYIKHQYPRAKVYYVTEQLDLKTLGKEYHYENIKQ